VARVALLAESTDARASEVVVGEAPYAAQVAELFDHWSKAPPQNGLSVEGRAVGEAGAHGE
jgi:hypothetical protein